MADRDWYAEWLLGEVTMHAPRVQAARVNVELSEIALRQEYRRLTGTELPPRPTEEEVGLWLLERQRMKVLGVEFDDPTLALQRAATSDDIRERMFARAVVEMPMGGGS